MKTKTVFACQECGAQSQKWLGRCPECGAWNSLVEERAAPEAVAAAADVAKRYSLAATAGPQLYADIDTLVAERLTTGIGEFDRVLGGGVVPGIAGAHRRRAGHRQVDAAAAGGRALRAGRSGRCSTARARSPSTRSSRAASGSAIERAPLYILAETCLERILEEIARLKPAFIIVDSIQTVFSLQVPVGARQHRPGARGGDAAAVCGQGPEHPDVSRRPRHQGRQPCRARRRSSTSSTRCSISRARSITRIASCAR